MHDVGLLSLTILLLGSLTGLWSPSSARTEAGHQEEELTIEIGDNVTVVCSSQDLSIPVIWTRSSYKVTERKSPAGDHVVNDTHVISRDSVLRINNATWHDAAIYICLQTALQSNEHTPLRRVLLHVKYSPVILTDGAPGVVVTALGDSVQLICDADGYPAPNVTWRRAHGHSTPRMDDIVFLGNRLNISNVKKGDSGIYSCEADNGVGKRAQWEVLVQVETPPEIILLKPEVSQAINYSAELLCNIEGFPSPSVQWLKEGHDEEVAAAVGNDTALPYAVTTTSSSGGPTTAVSASLKLPSVRRIDFGNYTCRAENKLGVANATVTLSESPFPVLPLLKTETTDAASGESNPKSFYYSSFNVTGFILGMMPPLWISFYIILHLGFRSRYAEERPEEEGGDGLDEIVWEQGFHSKY